MKKKLYYLDPTQHFAIVKPLWDILYCFVGDYFEKGIYRRAYSVAQAWYLMRRAIAKKLDIAERYIALDVGRIDTIQDK